MAQDLTVRALIADVGRGNLLASFFCLALVVANHAIFRLGAMPWVWVLVVVVVLCVVALLAPTIEIGGISPGPLRGWSLAIGIVVLLPVVASLALGWQREFPFSGDHAFHLKQTFYMVYWWASTPGSATVGLLGRTLGPENFQEFLARPWVLLWSRGMLLTLIVAMTWWCYRCHRLLALGFATAALIIWALFEQTSYLRYPGGGYVFALPFVVPAYGLGNLELTLRLPNVMAAAAWLFVLRPWLVGRWPDASILPVAALLLWQKDVIYYLDSAYLEPWAFIFSLCAIEVLIVRGRAGAPVACLLIGLAAAFKEPTIFALPFVWLAGAPWQGSWRDRARVTGTSIAAGFPFVLFYFAHKNVAAAGLTFDRAIAFDFSFSHLLDYLAGAWPQMRFAYSGASALPMVAALAVIVFFLARRTSHRLQIACSFACGGLLALIFVWDANSTGYAGYFRYFFYALPFLVTGTVVFGHYVQPRIALAIGGIILFLQAPSAYVAIARSAGPASDRNFVEHYDAPLVFPIKSLIREAKKDGIVPPRATFLANRPDFTVQPVPGIDVMFGPLGELICECRAEQPNVLAIFVRYANMNSEYGEHAPSPGQPFTLPLDRDRIWRENRTARPACLMRLRQTCGRVLERVEGGEVVGALGVR